MLLLELSSNPLPKAEETLLEARITKRSRSSGASGGVVHHLETGERRLLGGGG